MRGKSWPIRPTERRLAGRRRCGRRRRQRPSAEVSLSPVWARAASAHRLVCTAALRPPRNCSCCWLLRRLLLYTEFAGWRSSWPSSIPTEQHASSALTARPLRPQRGCWRGRGGRSRQTPPCGQSSAHPMGGLNGLRCARCLRCRSERSCNTCVWLGRRAVVDL